MAKIGNGNGCDLYQNRVFKSSGVLLDPFGENWLLQVTWLVLTVKLFVSRQLSSRILTHFQS